MRRGGLGTLWAVRREARATGQRAGQVLDNAASELGHPDSFYVEDDDLRAALDDQRDRRLAGRRVGRALGFLAWVDRQMRRA